MAWFDFLALVLAVRAVIDVWRNGSLFDAARQRVDDSDRWWAGLLSCWFCLSYHVPVWLLVACYIPGELHHGLWKLPIYALAVTEGSILLNLLLPEPLGYERHAEPDEPPIPENSDVLVEPGPL